MGGKKVRFAADFDPEQPEFEFIRDMRANTRKVVVSVQGMTCGSCVSAVTSGLEELDGVSNVAVSLITEQASMEVDGLRIGVDEVVERVEDCGFDCHVIEQEKPPGGDGDGDNDSIQIKIYGMTCSNCTTSVENALRSMDGVRSAVVALATEQATVEYDTNKVGPRDLIESIEDCGFDAVLAKVLDNDAQIEALSRMREIQQHRRDLIKCLVYAIPISILCMFVPHFLPFLGFLKTRLAPGLYLDDCLSFGLAIPVQFGVGGRFYRNAFKAIKHGSPTMDVLVCLSTSCAFLFSCVSVVSAVTSGYDDRPSTLWDTATMLITFVQLGKYLENKAKGQTSVALSRLISLVPSQATIYASKQGYETGSDLSEKTVATELLQVNDVVCLRPGEKVPADGVIISGNSYLSESLITGESLPINKGPGDVVIGGSVNGPGKLDFCVARTGNDTKLSQIVRLVSDAQTSRAPVQRYADLLAGYFVPTVIVLGIGTFALWMIVAHAMDHPPMALFNESEGSFMVCLRLCISVIVVACPCALGLATPTAVMVATGVGAENGILIKGGAILETANSVDTVLFDKTGTLTVGTMLVTNSSLEGDLMWRLIGALESGSEHPVAQSICLKSQEMLKSEHLGVNVSDFEVRVGNGVFASCSYQSHTYKVVAGNSDLFDQLAIEYPQEQLEPVMTSGETVILVAVDGKFAGWVSLSDAVKPEAELAINALTSLGVQVGMVTGDHINVALKVGAQLGIEDSMVWAGVSPAGKIDLIENLREDDDRCIAMVGDGINDSPALAAADLGIAITGATDVAMEAADIVLLKHDGLTDVAAALHLSRAAFRRIKINLGWALVYNLIMIPFAMGFFIPFGIVLHPMVAGFAMAISSVSVVVSSLFLQQWHVPNWEKLQPSDQSSASKGLRRLFTSSSEYAPVQTN